MRVLHGLLGWSNKRSGVEFYRYNEKVVPRHRSERGDLLAEEEGIADQEGSPVVVVVLPRGTPAADVHDVRSLIVRALNDHVGEAS